MYYKLGTPGISDIFVKDKESIEGNDHEVEFHEIKCFYAGKRSLDRISLDQNCHFSLDRKF